MKLDLTLPSGLQIFFEGEPDDFATLVEQLRLSEAVESGQAAAPQLPPGQSPPPGTIDPPAEDDPLNPKVLQARLNRVEAKNHIERVTVMAQAAVEAGMEGIDFPTVERLYGALAIPKPGKWKSTFSNARTRGFVVNVGRGSWKPTIPGENYALYGREASPPPARRRSQARPQTLELQSGGDDDS
ncbi:MAG: hypothetical protein BroJett022_03410 [Actinomycetes bacterium]|nr:MAG: hypothetical protein BroJett022_03410 [Actinomycetes bacterium]